MNSYEHAQYYAGLNVYIDPDSGGDEDPNSPEYLDPSSPVGKIVKTCSGEIIRPGFKSEHDMIWDLKNGRWRKSTEFVPISYQGQTWYIEPEYIHVD